MNENIILLPVIIPLVCGIVALAMKRLSGVKEAISLLATASVLVLSILLFRQEMAFSLPWVGLGIEFSLRLYHFSASVILATSIFAFLFVLYSCSFMHNKNYLNQFYCYLLVTVAMVNGAVLSDNLVLMFFFWEGLLLDGVWNDSDRRRAERVQNSD